MNSGDSLEILSGEAQKALKSISDADDPFQAEHFDLVEYINTLFPNEQSLVNLDETASRVAQEIQDIDVEIAQIIHSQSTSCRDGQTALQEARVSIQDLFTKIRDIKQKTDMSEEMVKEITRDIKQLDYAKRHLTSSITTLNHLHMLLNGVELLQSQTRRREYSEISNLLPGIVNVMDHFKRYTGVPQVRELSDKVAEIKKELSETILSEFKDSVSGGKPFVTSQHMADACRVVSVLDSDVREELIKWILQQQLSVYVVLFEDTQDTAWLDSIDQRFVWFKKQMIHFEEVLAPTFPKDWEMKRRLAIEFCNITAKELSKVMKKRSNEIDAKLLQHAIRRTHDFESMLAHLFPPAPKKPDNTTSVPQQEVPSLKGLISKCFEEYLSVFTAAQDTHLSDLLNRLVEGQRASGIPRRETESGSVILPSSGDLFVFCKTAMQKCMEFSSADKLLVDLTQVFKKYLKEYANRCLMGFLPKAGPAAALSTSAGLIQAFLKEGEMTKLSANEVFLVCCILTTAEYCADTVEKMQEKLKKLVSQEYHSKIDLLQEKSLFHSVVSTCVQLLVQNLECTCDPALQALTKIQWSSLEQVGDESGYVGNIRNHIRSTVPQVRDYLLQECRKYYTNFCSNFAKSFIAKYTNCLYRCRGVSVTAAEQLLLDTHALKTELLGLPVVGSSMVREPPAAYTKLVVKGMTKAEMILKVVMSAHDTAEQFVSNYTKLLPESELSEFQKVLEMKGIKRADQNILIETYRLRKTGSGSTAATEATQSSPAAPLMALTAAHKDEDDSGILKLQKLQKLVKKRF